MPVPLHAAAARRSAILSLIIVKSSVCVEGLATKPYRRLAMTTAVDK
jgi:hypothetical protein